MDITRATHDIITFQHQGLGRFEVELENSTIISCKFMANGDEANGVFTAKDWDFISAVHKSLGELIQFKDEGNGAMLPAPRGHAPVKTEEPIITETKDTTNE